MFGGFLPLWPSDERDGELTAEMQAYWTHFAAKGDPNQPGKPRWPLFEDRTPQEIAFGHDRTAAQPVEREARYRAMQAQFERRIKKAGPKK